MCARFITAPFRPNVPPPPASRPLTFQLPAPYVPYTLRRTRLNASETFCALFLLSRIKGRFSTTRGSSNHRLFFSVFMIALESDLRQYLLEQVLLRRRPGNVFSPRDQSDGARDVLLPRMPTQRRAQVALRVGDGNRARLRHWRYQGTRSHLNLPRPLSENCSFTV